MSRSFYSRPIFDSFYFRANTTGLFVDLILGTWILLEFWSGLLILIRLYIIACMVGLVGFWVRAIVDHRAMRKQLAESSDVTYAYMLQAAAMWPTYGLSMLYLFAATLLFSLGFTIKHYEGVLIQGCASVLK